MFSPAGEKELRVAEGSERPTQTSSEIKKITFDIKALKKNFALTQYLLNHVLKQNNPDLIKKILEIYRTFPQQNVVLVNFAQAQLARTQQNYSQAVDFYQQILQKQPKLNAVRIALATALLENKQLKQAKQQFEQVLLTPNLSPKIQQQLQSYLNSIEQQQEWNIDVSAYYLREKNVNNASKSPFIENKYIKNLKKNDSMLPQKATGFGYEMDLNKAYNFAGNHYLFFRNQLDGKYFWDNHDYDEITNRTTLGYQHRQFNQRIQILPFYEKTWFGGNSYNWGVGVRLNYDRWFASNWQFISALEYATQRYYDSNALNGHSKLFSNTVVWHSSPRQNFSLGLDLYKETTQAEYHRHHRVGVRLGWSRVWDYSIVSQLNLNFAKRQYRGEAQIGGLPLGKTRQDNLYRANLTLWKQDWQLWKIIPKLQFSYYRQSSNIPSLYSYSNKMVNIVFERSF